MASKALVQVHIGIAESLENSGQFQEGISHYLQCIQILEREQNEKSISDIEFRLGKAYKEIGNIPTAIKVFLIRYS